MRVGVNVNVTVAFCTLHILPTIQVRVGVNVTVAFCMLHILPTLHILSTLQVRDSATAIPMPDLSTPSSSSPQPGLCGPSDKEYSTRWDEIAITLVKES